MAKKKAAAMDYFPGGEGMRRVSLVLRGTAPYSPSGPILAVKRDKQSPDDFDEEHWRERGHYNEDGFVCLAPQSLYLALLQACMLRGEKIQGRGNKTWTDTFTTGVMLETALPVLLPTLKAAQVACDKRFVPADGMPAFRSKGGSKRVWRRFPLIPAGWRAEVTFSILQETITEDVFMRHLIDAGRFIGVGRFRPASRGFYGRFAVESAEWEG